MSKAFSQITFTPAVREWQERHGSRQSYQRFEQGPLSGDRLGPDEQEFVSSIDGFYQSTVSSSGWPYVQFRGGRPGFLRVLNEQTIGYADLRGNKQFLSMGNLSTDDRVMLFLMDYENQQRLKIWGRARISEDPKLIQEFAAEYATGKPERAVLIQIEAYDWNCSQHIPKRYTLEAR